jgi:hypothetical protein
MGDSGRIGGLARWFEAPPESGTLRAACRELVGLSASIGDGQIASAAEQAARPSAESAFGLGAALLNCGEPEKADLGRCWLWVAAALGHERAIADIARELAAEAASPAPRVPVGQIAAALAAWLGGQRPAPVPWRGGMVRAADEAEDDGPEEAEVDGVVVVRRIGDADSREGRDLSKRYAHLIGKRLPRRGEMPDPHKLSADFVAKFPWAEILARYLEGQFALLRSSGNRHPRLPPLLLVGPSGCGKTTMLEWLCAYCGLPSMTVPVAGTSDAAGLGAVARGWVTAQVSAPVQLMADHGCCNPAMILDEVDKGVSDMSNRNGSVMGVLLSMLQPPAEGYRDSCLMSEVEMNEITFLATANTLDTLSLPFRRRFLALPVPAPRAEDFGAILPGALEQVAAKLGIDQRMLPWFGRDEKEWLRSVFLRRLNIGDLNTALRVLVGELAAQESAAMRRPH